jgi:hypothetical protein
MLLLSEDKAAKAGFRRERETKGRILWMSFPLTKRRPAVYDRYVSAIVESLLEAVV